MGGPKRLSATWRLWLATNALRAVSRDKLVDVLEANGVPRRVAGLEVEAVLGSPYLAAARRVRGLAARHDLRARLERETGRLARGAGSIERRQGLPADAFFERYYAHGIPVIMTDTFEVWPELRTWSPRAFAERWPDARVRVTTGRADDLGTHTHFGEPGRTLALAALCELIASSGATNEFYLISDEFQPPRAGLAPLLTDVRASHPLLDETRDGRCMILWFGPTGTVTPLHHDTKSVLLCQVYGRKSVLLFPRFEAPLLGAGPDTLYRPFDVDRPQESAFPDMADALRKTVVLEPGDSLFIPVGCFHQMRALDPSISLGFSNFRRYNRHPSYTPGALR